MIIAREDFWNRYTEKSKCLLLRENLKKDSEPEVKEDYNKMYQFLCRERWEEEKHCYKQLLKGTMDQFCCQFKNENTFLK